MKQSANTSNEVSRVLGLLDEFEADLSESIEKALQLYTSIEKETKYAAVRSNQLRSEYQSAEAALFRGNITRLPSATNSEHHLQHNHSRSRLERSAVSISNGDAIDFNKTTSKTSFASAHSSIHQENGINGHHPLTEIAIHPSSPPLSMKSTSQWPAVSQNDCLKVEKSTSGVSLSPKADSQSFSVSRVAVKDPLLEQTIENLLASSMDLSRTQAEIAARLRAIQNAQIRSLTSRHLQQTATHFNSYPNDELLVAASSKPTRLSRRTGGPVDDRRRGHHSNGQLLGRRKKSDIASSSSSSLALSDTTTADEHLLPKPTSTKESHHRRTRHTVAAAGASTTRTTTTTTTTAAAAAATAAATTASDGPSTSNRPIKQDEHEKFDQQLVTVTPADSDSPAKTSKSLSRHSSLRSATDVELQGGTVTSNELKSLTTTLETGRSLAVVDNVEEDNKINGRQQPAGPTVQVDTLMAPVDPLFGRSANSSMQEGETDSFDNDSDVAKNRSNQPEMGSFRSPPTTDKNSKPTTTATTATTSNRPPTPTKPAVASRTGPVDPIDLSSVLPASGNDDDDAGSMAVSVYEYPTESEVDRASPQLFGVPVAVGSSSPELSASFSNKPTPTPLASNSRGRIDQPPADVSDANLVRSSTESDDIISPLPDNQLVVQADTVDDKDVEDNLAAFSHLMQKTTTDVEPEQKPFSMTGDGDDDDDDDDSGDSDRIEKPPKSPEPVADTPAVPGPDQSAKTVVSKKKKKSSLFGVSSSEDEREQSNDERGSKFGSDAETRFDSPSMSQKPSRRSTTAVTEKAPLNNVDTDDFYQMMLASSMGANELDSEEGDDELSAMMSRDQHTSNRFAYGLESASLSDATPGNSARKRDDEADSDFDFFN